VVFSTDIAAPGRPGPPNPVGGDHLSVER
jgi:hypothetical protein